MSWKWYKSLNFKVPILLMCTLIVVILFMWALIEHEIEQQAKQEISEKSRLLLESVEYSATSLLDVPDMYALSRLLENLAANPFVKSIKVCDEFGTILSSSNMYEIGEKCPSNMSDHIFNKHMLKYNYLDGDAYYAAIPMIGKNYSNRDLTGIQGLILMIGDVRYEKSIISKSVMAIFTEFTGLLIMNSLLMMIFLNYLIIRPLRVCKKTISSISEGDYDIQAPIRTNDEIGELANALNNMSDKIKSSNNKINEHYQLLSEYKNAIDISAIVIKSDFTGKITYINNVFKDISGFTDEDIVGKSINTLRGTELNEDAILNYWDSLLNCVVWKEVVNNKTKDGRDYYVNVTVSPIQDSEGEIVEYLDIWHDVTEIYELKEELQEHKDNLELLVEKRTSALIGANRKLTDYGIKFKKLYEAADETNKKLKEAQTTIIQQEKMVSIGHLAAGVAHELNNPVGFVSSNFETLKIYIHKIKEYQSSLQVFIDTYEQSDNISEQIQHIKQLKRKLKIDFILGDIEDIFTESDEGFERVTSIVNNLRSFSRVDFNEIKEPYDLNAGIENTIVVARNEIKYVAEVETHLNELPMINAFGGEINQVLLNIIVNASQAIGDQQRNEKGLIEVTTSYNDNLVNCTIKDDGPGIPKDIITKVFDPFFTTKEPGKGTGLGLNISYDIIVNKHKGNLSVNSNENGTEFIIELPITTEEDQNDII